MDKVIFERPTKDGKTMVVSLGSFPGANGPEPMVEVSVDGKPCASGIPFASATTPAWRKGSGKNAPAGDWIVIPGSRPALFAPQGEGRAILEAYRAAKEVADNRPPTLDRLIEMRRDLVRSIRTHEEADSTRSARAWGRGDEAGAFEAESQGSVEARTTLQAFDAEHPEVLAETKLRSKALALASIANGI